MLKKLLLAMFCLTSTPSLAADKLTVMLDWFVNPDHAPLVIAKEKGFFAQQGLDVTLQQPGDPNDPPKLAAAGKVDIALGYQPQLHLQVAEGLPLRRIGTLIGQPLNTLLVLEDSGITSPAQLKGKKIGYSVGGVEEALLSAILEKHGLTLKDVQLINVNFSLSPALLSGQVDAVIGAYRNFELHQLAKEGRRGRAFLVENEGVPAYDELIFLTRTDKSNDPRLPRFFKALEQALTAIRTDPKGTMETFFTAYPETNDAINRAAWKDTLPTFAADMRTLHKKRYEEFSQFLAARKLIPAPQKANDVAAGER
ncbi:MAG: ABC transporter substrate-binding protein [Holosporales bacterium]